MNLTDFLIWIPPLILLGYSIPACYYDLKYREMPVGFWTGLLVVCVPITVILYWIGIYPWYCGLVSLAMAIVYYMLYCMGLFQGADFVYLLWIILFLVKNPVSGNILMPASFAIFLLAAIVGMGIIYQVFRHLACKHGELVFLDMPQKDLPGFPFMIPISLALWLTVGLA